ncbi:hypothetical protein BGZ63DRAFT_350404 [Mariannaea sp. PMI_226]|nr:hypothetical protein BGZ63DRAFT_350404 [Mariannaea sp. PMI_226]
MAKFLHLSLLALVAFVSLGAADITIQIEKVKPLALDTTGVATSPDDLFRRSCPEEFDERNGYTPKIIVSSYDDVTFPKGEIFPSSDGLIRGAIEAWAKHQHLVLRPDEVWFEILAQLNFYMTVHAEDVRNLFVNHKGKEEIHVEAFTWRDVVASFGAEIQKRVKTKWLLGWIMPGFSTSTDNDEMTATVLMMGLMQYYFEFSGSVTCGIPSVTLLGQKKDWEKLLGKLEHLKDWGKEPTQYAKNLRPILKRFVQTWDEPNSPEVKKFWSQIVRANKVFSCGRGPSEYDVSGWITGFLHWRRAGTLRIEKPEEIQESPNTVTLDGVIYVPEPLEDIRVGYAKAPLKMVDFPEKGDNTSAYLLAGNVGVLRKKDRKGRITAQPTSSWSMLAPVDFKVKQGSYFGSWDELKGIADGLGTCKAW